MLRIREATPGDYAAIREINRRAFQGDVEAQLVDRLRHDGVVIASLVAVQDGEIVGHILFSQIAIETGEHAIAAASLAPMAVEPDFQRRGIGSALVRHGLEVCRARGRPVVVVVGHPEYYPRFGFSAKRAGNLRGPCSGEAWMALELVPGALDGIKGEVRYPEAFDASP
jgi:putative acetyltransferase